MFAASEASYVFYSKINYNLILNINNKFFFLKLKPSLAAFLYNSQHNNVKLYFEIVCFLF